MLWRNSKGCGKALNGKLFYECGCPIPSQFASVNNLTISKVETTEIPARDMVILRVDLVLTSVSADGKNPTVTLIKPGHFI